MIIDKKLVHFNQNEDFNERNNNGDILDSSIVFVKDTNRIYTHGEKYQFIQWTVLSRYYYSGVGIGEWDELNINAE